MMTHHSANNDLLPYLYQAETDLAGLFDRRAYAFSPILVAGQVGIRGFIIFRQQHRSPLNP
jgi:hypothetical protein